nr:MAG TPA: hypothetical protein [Caudoviricetes sp.]
MYFYMFFLFFLSISKNRRSNSHSKKTLDVW